MRRPTAIPTTPSSSSSSALPGQRTTRTTSAFSSTAIATRRGTPSRKGEEQHLFSTTFSFDFLDVMEDLLPTINVSIFALPKKKFPVNIDPQKRFFLKTFHSTCYAGVVQIITLVFIQEQ